MHILVRAALWMFNDRLIRTSAAFRAKMCDTRIVSNDLFRCLDCYLLTKKTRQMHFKGINFEDSLKFFPNFKRMSGLNVRESDKTGCWHQSPPTKPLCSHSTLKLLPKTGLAQTSCRKVSRKNGLRAPPL